MTAVAVDTVRCRDGTRFPSALRQHHFSELRLESQHNGSWIYTASGTSGYSVSASRSCRSSCTQIPHDPFQRVCLQKFQHDTDDDFGDQTSWPMMRKRPRFGLHALMIMTTMTSIPGASKNGLTDFGFLFFSIHYGGLLSLGLNELGSFVGVWRARRYIISVLSNSTFFKIACSQKRVYCRSHGSRKVCWP